MRFFSPLLGKSSVISQATYPMTIGGNPATIGGVQATRVGAFENMNNDIYGVAGEDDVLWAFDQITTSGWWDPSDTDNITESGGLVSKLDDIGSSGIEHMEQLSGASQPTTGTRTLGGLNILDCDGNDWLGRSGFAVPSSGNLSIFMVAEFDSISIASDSAFSMNTGNHFQFDANSSTMFNGRILATGIGSTVTLTGGPFSGPSIYCINFDFTNSIYNSYIDGTQRAVDTAYSAKLDVSQYFRLFSNKFGSQSIGGGLGEVVATEDTSQDTREKAFGSLAWKWDGGVAGPLVAALDPSNPYKTAPPTV